MKSSFVHATIEDLEARNRVPHQLIPRKMLEIGSNVEVAERVGEDLHRAQRDVIHAEGHFWRYRDAHWASIPEHELRRAVHAYDGADFRNPKGDPSRAKLSKGRIDSALNELAAKVEAPSFFEKAAIGINCASGFVRFSRDGKASLEPHDPDHR